MASPHLEAQWTMVAQINKDLMPPHLGGFGDQPRGMTYPSTCLYPLDLWCANGTLAHNYTVCWLLSLNKWVNSILTSRSFFFFLIQLLLKIPLIELSNRFVFHRSWAVGIQSIFKFLQLIHDFLANTNSIRRGSVAEWLVHSISVPLLRIGEQFWFPCNPDHCGY